MRDVAERRVDFLDTIFLRPSLYGRHRLGDQAIGRTYELHVAQLGHRVDTIDGQTRTNGAVSADGVDGGPAGVTNPRQHVVGDVGADVHGHHALGVDGNGTADRCLGGERRSAAGALLVQQARAHFALRRCALRLLGHHRFDQPHGLCRQLRDGLQLRACGG